MSLWHIRHSLSFVSPANLLSIHSAHHSNCCWPPTRVCAPDHHPLGLAVRQHFNPSCCLPNQPIIYLLPMRNLLETASKSQQSTSEDQTKMDVSLRTGDNGTTLVKLGLKMLFHWSSEYLHLFLSLLPSALYYCKEQSLVFNRSSTMLDHVHWAFRIWTVIAQWVSSAHFVSPIQFFNGKKKQNNTLNIYYWISLLTFKFLTSLLSSTIFQIIWKCLRSL